MAASASTRTAVTIQSRRPPREPPGRSTERTAGAEGAAGRPEGSTTVMAGASKILGPRSDDHGARWSRFEHLAVHLHRLRRHPTPGELTRPLASGGCERLPMRLVFEKLSEC